MTAAPFKLWYFSAGDWHLYGTYIDAATAKRFGGGLAQPTRHQPATWLKPTGEPLETIPETASDKPVFPGGRHEAHFPRSGR